MRICIVCHRYAVPIDDPCCYPLGYMYVSAMLKKMGHMVKVLNYNLWDFDFEKEIDGADRVLFTGFEEFFPLIQRDAAICKEKGIKTMIGGALATYLPALMSAHVDTVVTGEAESVLNEALHNIGIINGSPPSLSILPLPDYEGFGIEEYHRRHRIRYMGVLTSRGCPYRCTFCAHICKYQPRKLQEVFDEVDLYRERYGVEMIIFNDNTINIERNRFLALCRGMKERKLHWSAAIRADVWDEEITQTAKESGLDYVVIGVESFNQDRLNRMKKRITVQQITRALGLLQEYGIGYSGNVLVGFEDDTVVDIHKEVSSIPPQYRIFPVMVQPFVGTKNGHTRKITKEQYNNISGIFREYIEKMGKYLYPELPEEGPR